MDFASLMKSQIASAQPPKEKKYLKRSEVEAQRQADYLREQEELEQARIDRLEKKRKRDEEEAERNAAREAKKQRLAAESRKRAEEEAEVEEAARRKRLGLPELEKKIDTDSEGTPLKEGEEDIPEDDLRDELRQLSEPTIFFGETHPQRLRRYRNLTAPKNLTPTLTKGPIPTTLQLVEEKDMKVPSTVPNDPAGKLLLHRQIASYFHLILTSWSLALSQRPAALKTTFEGKKAYASYTSALENLRPLIKSLEPPSPSLPTPLLQSITEIVHLMQLKRYVDANDAYLRLSIGKAAWPIGVTMVGIHERSAREKLHASDDGGVGGKAHILADERTRKMLQGVKRCVSFAQTRWPPGDLGQLMG